MARKKKQEIVYRYNQQGMDRQLMSLWAWEKETTPRVPIEKCSKH